MTDRVERVLAAVAVALSIAWIVLVCFRPSGTIDIWWTLAVGDYLLTEREVPRTVLWAIEPLRDLPYVCHGWLGALIYGAVERMFGLDAVPAVPAAVGLGLLASLLGLARQLGAPWLLAVTSADLALWAVLPRMHCRVEVFGYLYFALALNLAASQLRAPRLRGMLWFVPLALLWVNSHGSFVLLLALLPLLALGRALDLWRRADFAHEALRAALLSKESVAFGVVFSLVAAATLVNPYGTALLGSVLAQSTSNVWHAAIAEWRPAHALPSLRAELVVLGYGMFAALALGRGRVASFTVLLAAITFVLALSARRHLPLFGLGAAFVFGEAAGRLVLGRGARAALAAALLACLAAGSWAALAPLDADGRRLSRHPSPAMTPAGLDYVRSHVRGNVLNRWSLGGLLIYYGRPQLRVSIDSRADPYPAAYFHRYQRALYGTAEDTREFVDAFAIDHIILDRALYTKSFRDKLPGLPGFREAFVDERTAVLSRDVR